MKIKVFIVDDHFMVIEGIRAFFQHDQQIEWMGYASNAASCLAFLKQQQPDVVLMDINLPDRSGVELCKEVRQKYPDVFILGLSTFNQHAIIRDMIDNGASGYLLKNANRSEILAAIVDAAAGKTYLSTESAMALRDHSKETTVITRREKEILQLIAQGLTNSEIAAQLFISIPTVNTHRKSLLEKFEAKNTAILIGKATKQGLV